MHAEYWLDYYMLILLLYAHLKTNKYRHHASATTKYLENGSKFFFSCTLIETSIVGRYDFWHVLLCWISSALYYYYYFWLESLYLEENSLTHQFCGSSHFKDSSYRQTKMICLESRRSIKKQTQEVSVWKR